MKLIFTNAFGNRGNVEKKEIEIKGKCIITNYDSRTHEPSGAGDLTVVVDGENSSIKKGATVFQEDSETVNLNNAKYSIFTALAAMDKNGSDSELTFSDLDVARHSGLQKLKDILKSLQLEIIGNPAIDPDKGIFRLNFKNKNGQEEVIRIDFETESEQNAKTVDENMSAKQNARVDDKSDDETEGDETETVKDTGEVVKNKTATGSGNPLKIRPAEYYSDDSENSMVAFLDSLAFRESSYRYTKTNKSGYVGWYQMGESALVDLGIYKRKKNSKENSWEGIFVKNKYNITSLWDFKHSPDKQTQAIKDYMKINWRYIKSFGLDSYLGKTINGQTITASSLLAGAHLVGVGGLKTYLASNGTNDVTDGDGIHGTPISEYIRKYAGYDVSELI